MLNLVRLERQIDGRNKYVLTNDIADLLHNIHPD